MLRPSREFSMICLIATLSRLDRLLLGFLLVGLEVGEQPIFVRELVQPRRVSPMASLRSSWEISPISLSGQTSSPELHSSFTRPSGAQGEDLGKPVVVDQQDPLADDLLGDLVEHGEEDGPSAQGEQAAQRDPGVDRRHPDQRVELLHGDP